MKNLIALVVLALFTNTAFADTSKLVLQKEKILEVSHRSVLQQLIAVEDMKKEVTEARSSQSRSLKIGIPITVVGAALASVGVYKIVKDKNVILKSVGLWLGVLPGAVILVGGSAYMVISYAQLKRLESALGDKEDVLSEMLAQLSADLLELQKIKAQLN